MHTDTPENIITSTRLMRMPGVCNETGDARSTVYRKIKDGLFPAPVKSGVRAAAWPATEVAAVNAARIAGRSDDEIRTLVRHLVAARRTVMVR